VLAVGTAAKTLLIALAGKSKSINFPLAMSALRGAADKRRSITPHCARQTIRAALEVNLP
jgi:hypothetical protein